MKLLTEKEIMAYIACREWVGCAGGYSIQGRAKSVFSHSYLDVIQMLLACPLPSLIGVLRQWDFIKSNMKTELIIEKYGTWKCCCCSR